MPLSVDARENMVSFAKQEDKGSAPKSNRVIVPVLLHASTVNMQRKFQGVRLTCTRRANLRVKIPAVLSISPLLYTRLTTRTCIPRMAIRSCTTTTLDQESLCCVSCFASKLRHTSAIEVEVKVKVQARGGRCRCVTLTCTQQARSLALERDMPTFNSPRWEAAPQTQLSLDVCDASGRVQSRIDLEGKSHVVLGRDASAVEVAVDDRGVSRTHAAIVHHRNGRVYLIDLKSTHGTKVDGEALEAHKPTRLKEGSKVQLGHAQTLYVVHLHGARKPSSAHDAETKQEVPREAPKQVQTKPQDSDAGNKHAMVRCSHILVKHKDSRRPSSWKEKVVTRTKEEALRMVARMREDILVGHATFAELAKTESHCSSAKKGGDLGEFAKGSMQPQFEEQAFALAVGKISQPFLSDSGAHIILRTS